MDSRIEKYIEKCKDNIGLTHGRFSSAQHVEFSEIYDTFTQDGIRLDGFAPPTITIGKDKNNNYVILKVNFNSTSEDLEYISYFFKEKPTKKSYYKAEKIAKFKYYCMGRNLTGKCWECGITFYILELSGNIDDKISKFENSYCGC